MNSNLLKYALLGTMAMLMVSGCYVRARGVGVGVYADYPVVTVEPPAPTYEEVGVAPSPGYVWIGGYWGWSGGAYAWQPGHWEAPRPGHVWVPHTWRREGSGWRMSGGHWERR